MHIQYTNGLFYDFVHTVHIWLMVYSPKVSSEMSLHNYIINQHDRCVCFSTMSIWDISCIMQLHGAGDHIFENNHLILQNGKRKQPG